MRRAAACLATLAACAGHTAPPAGAGRAELPRLPPSTSPPSSTDVAVASDTAPAACLPPSDTATVTLLDGDARTVHVCVGTPLLDPRAEIHCFAIDRRRGAIASWTPPGTGRSMPPRRSPNAHYDLFGDRDGEVCANGRGCIATHWVTHDHDDVISADIDHGRAFAVVVTRHRVPSTPPHFDIYEDVSPRHRIEIGDGFACGTALTLADAVFIATDDCESATGHGFFFDLHGRRIAAVGGAHPLDTYGAYPVSIDRDRWAIVTPAAYAIDLVDLPMARYQDVIDLVPIQARATDHPDFFLAETAEGAWAIASPTGGVGVIDPSAGKLVSSWIIPPCGDAAP